VAAAAFLALAAPRVGAQDDASAGDSKAPVEDRISFVVQGTAAAPADQLEVELTVQAQGEDGESAEKRHRAKLKAVSEALDKLKADIDGKNPANDKKSARHRVRPKKSGDDEDDDDADEDAKKKADKPEPAPRDESPDPPSFSVDVREGRSTVGIGAGVSNDGTQTPPSVTVATAVFVRMKGIAQVSRAKLRRRVARILDTAIDAGADSGLDGGTRPAFHFRAADNEDLRARAHEDALNRARPRAARLARLAGRELGKCTLVTELSWILRSGKQDEVGFDSVIGKIGSNSLNNYEMTTSTTEIEIESNVQVEFELGRELQDRATAEGPARK
jgi:uncharacterized protein YggE